MDIIFLDAATVGNVPNLGKIKEFGTLTTYQNTQAEEVAKRIKGAEVVITNKVPLTKAVISEAKALKLICVAATGMNNIDVEAAKARQILIKNVEDYSTHSVAQHTLSLVLELLNRPALHHEYVFDGSYSRNNQFTYLGSPYWQLHGKRFGIIGLGHIGSQVARIAEAFGCEIVYWSSSGKDRNPSYQRLELDDLLSSSDVVSIHAPLSDQTNQLISYEKIQLMKDQALLINTSRGGIIKEDDLARATHDRLIRGAAIDVFSEEPLPEDHPYLKTKDPDRLLLTPHVAWASIESRTLLIDRICENIRDFLKDAPRGDTDHKG